MNRSYAYRGRSASGKLVKGVVEAQHEMAAADELRSMGVSPISVFESAKKNAGKKHFSIPGFHRHLKLSELSVMSRQMSTMLGSGLTVLRTLRTLSEQIENPELAQVMKVVGDDVENGSTISGAFSKHTAVFPPLMISMIEAGETGGYLDGAVESVAENFEKEVRLRGKIKSAMTYPVIVLIMSLLSVGAMLVFIVPVFDKMFIRMGSQLPLPTQILISSSRALVFILPVLIVAIVIFTTWWQKNRHTIRVRKFIDPLKLKLPVFGKLIKKIAIARFSRNFSHMIGAGVPILTALDVVGRTSGNWAVEDALQKVAESVGGGQTLSIPLSAQPVFPTMVSRMIAVGEDAGSLELMLKKIADFYDQEVEAATEQLTAMIEPLLVAFLGVIVGGMIISLYLPIFNIATLIK